MIGKLLTKTSGMFMILLIVLGIAYCSYCAYSVWAFFFSLLF